MSLLATSALALVLTQPPQATATDPDFRSTVRTTQTLSEGWRFHYGEAPGAEAPEFSDDAWEAVSVPHTWNRAGVYLPNPETRTNTVETVNKEQGVGWYRLTFRGPDDLSGRKAWLQFDAASRTAEVWLNGQKLGDHRGGFSRFRFDATGALRIGGDNVLVVKTDNTHPTGEASTADVLPLRGDFFVHGGLYRPVSLIVTDDVHIDMLDFGGPGVYATTTRIDDTSAEVSVRARVRNSGLAAQPASLVAQLIDAEGRQVAEARRDIVLASNAEDEVTQTLQLNEPRLWQGVEDPYLYNLRFEIRDSAGRILDRVDHAYGVRQIAFDADRGTLLNGKPLQLRGTGYHQDRESMTCALESCG